MICHVASWPESMNHDTRVELVKAGPVRYRNKEGPFQAKFRFIQVGDSEKRVVSFLSVKWFNKTLKNG